MWEWDGAELTGLPHDDDRVTVGVGDVHAGDHGPGPGGRQRLHPQARKLLAADGDPVDGALRADLTTYLPDDLLLMADRMSMAHSIESRVPLLDNEVIDFAASWARNE